MKKYKAQYGYVREGDFALVKITPFIPYASGKIKPCYVADDGYVYTENERIQIDEGFSPICRLPQESTEEICKDSILKYYHYRIEKKLRTRVFECELTLRETLNDVSNVRVLKDTIRPTSLSKNASDEDIRKVLIRNMRKHHPYVHPYYVFGNINVVKRIEDGQAIVYDASEITWKEIKEDN